LAACLGVSDPASDPSLPPRVACVVDIHGLHDLPAMLGHKNAALCEVFTGGTLDEKRDLWEQASPIRQVNPDSAPMFITHDPADASVPYVQSTMLVEALRRAGRPVQFIPTPGSGHGFFYNPAHPWVARLWPAAVEWLDRFLLFKA
jgi:dipeptidyl aminopeptidase/acylaminoacyl peptidase